MSQHAVLAPSKAVRWMICTGGVAACAGITEDPSIYADEGTAAHAVASAWLKGEPSVDPLAALKTFYATESDYIDAINYIDSYVLAIRNAAEGKILLVEQHMDMERWTSEVGGKGTADAIIIDLPNRTIEVWDLKFGVGHVVWAAKNPQTMLYGLGALDMIEMIYGRIDKIKMVIFQPRRDHVDSETVIRAELLEFGKESYKAGEFALSLVGQPKEVYEQHLHPTPEGCLFCPIAGICVARQKQVRDSAFEKFTIVESGQIKYVTNPVDGPDWQTEEELDLIADWVAARRDYIYAQMRSGITNPNWKLILSRGGNRKFTDEDKVVKLLKSLKMKKEQIYEQHLIPLTKIEKLVPKGKWPVFEALIDRTPGQPMAVSVKHKKAAWDPKSSVDKFENVEEGLDAFK